MDDAAFMLNVGSIFHFSQEILNVLCHVKFLSSTTASLVRSKKNARGANKFSKKVGLREAFS